jgi:hypothetical protein
MRVTATLSTLSLAPRKERQRRPDDTERIALAAHIDGEVNLADALAIGDATTPTVSRTDSRPRWRYGVLLLEEKKSYLHTPRRQRRFLA